MLSFMKVATVFLKCTLRRVISKGASIAEYILPLKVLSSYLSVSNQSMVFFERGMTQGLEAPCLLTVLGVTPEQVGHLKVLIYTSTED
mmetsp:Transcript_14395/g.22353  ORF Transcript_14395/g.22353 Transcript_14395/m.22353 type:complete len:88 (-) Transcript_14395:365-628(-)